MSPRATGVRLRPATLADVPTLDAWSTSSEHLGEFADFALPRRSHAAALGQGASVPPTFMVVEVGGQLAGTVSWHPVDYGPVPGTAAWSIGISLDPPFRGQGVGTKAQRSVAVMLFATTPAHRVEASTDTRNVAEQKALERAGFQREGVARGAQWRAGGWHDLVTYARLRSD